MFDRHEFAEMGIQGKVGPEISRWKTNLSYSKSATRFYQSFETNELFSSDMGPSLTQRLELGLAKPFKINAGFSPSSGLI